jgi:hypothetical protein
MKTIDWLLNKVDLLLGGSIRSSTKQKRIMENKMFIIDMLLFVSFVAAIILLIIAISEESLVWLVYALCVFLLALLLTTSKIVMNNENLKLQLQQCQQVEDPQE